MSGRNLGIFVSLAAIFWSCLLRSDDRPNIILILADDLGYADLGAYGNKVNRTPHLDRMAREGMRFTDFHSNGANCSPTRAAILTGQYQQRCGIESALGEDAKGLPKDTVTIAERLHEAGYATGITGKWHLGYASDNSPLRHGFGEFIGHLHGATDYHSHVNRYGRMDWWHGEKQVKEIGYNTTLITKHSVRFIEEHHDKPFFLFVSHSAIHFPWMTPDDKPHQVEGRRYESSLAKLGPHAKGPVQPIVQRMIEELDRNVGDIMHTVERLKLHRNTLVFFTSDNGGILSMAGLPVKPENRISINDPLRGQKHDLYEGGHRVPAIAWWPGKIQPAHVSTELTATFDLMPTFLDLAGIEFDPSQLDGVSLADHLLAGKEVLERTLYWRRGKSKAVRWKNWKLVRIRERPFELYDLNTDKRERNNLANERREVKVELLARLKTWEEQFEATR